MKVEGTFHLTAHFVFPFLLLAALLHAPLLVRKSLGYGPGEGYFALLSLGLLGFVGFLLAQLLAQRALYPDWPRRLRWFPLFMAGSIGLAASNTRALWQALRGKRSAFVRTPKRSAGIAAPQPPAGARWTAIATVEAALLAYCVVGLGVIVGLGEWAAVPFQALFAAGFGVVTVYNLRARRAWRS